MDKNEVNRIIWRIRDKCIYANGNICELEYKTFNWNETYHSKKAFLGFKWIFSSSDSYYKEKMQECELILKKLPRGLTYTKKDILERDELQSIEPHKEYIYAKKCYKTIYTIQISETYSHNILMSLIKSRVFINNYIPSDMEIKALDFKKKVLSQYINLIKDMYVAFEQGNNFVSKLGISNNYDDGLKIAFSDYRLKPLLEEYQYIGLAFAIAEQGIMYLKPTELFCINNHSFGARISKIDTTSKDENDGLNEW